MQKPESDSTQISSAVEQKTDQFVLPTSLPPASRQRSSKINVAVLLAFAAFILMGANDGAFGVLIPSIRAFYGITAANLAWLFFIAVLGYLTASFNTGLLMAKLSVRRFLLLCIAIFMLSVGLISLELPFVLYLCMVGLLGFSVGMLDAGLNAYIASLPKNTVVLNYLHAFYGVGASTLLVWQLGWRATYLTWLGVALVIWLGLWLGFKPHVQTMQQTTDEKKDNRLLQTLHLRGVWLAAFFLLFYVGTEISMGNWGYSFLTNARLGPTLFSAWVVSGYWCGLTLGRLTLANLALRVGVRNLIYLCLAGVALGLLLAWFLPGLWGAAIGFCLTGFFLGPIFPTTIALTSQIAPARLLPSAIGFLASLASAGGALFPSLAGGLLQYLGFWFLLPFCLLLTAAMLAMWLILNKIPTPTTR